MSVKILVDSSSEFTSDELRQYNLSYVPISLIFNDCPYLIGIDITTEEFYHRLLELKEYPKTAQPSPDAFLRIFRQAKQKGDTVIAILLSSGLSGTVQCAHIAKQMAEYDDIHIIDSLSATYGVRILVDEAVRMRDNGYDAPQIVEAIEALKSRICIHAAVDTLEYLMRGGRVSRIEAAAGTVANIKPIITVNREGKVDVISKTIGRGRAINDIAKHLETHPADPAYTSYYIYSLDEGNCVTMRNRLDKKALHLPNSSQKNLGPTIGAHVGSGVFGVVYIPML